jgi:small conductance mechanosensitive channel
MDMSIDPEMLKSLQPLLISYGSKIIAALLIFLVGKWLARKISHVLVRLLESRKIDVTFVGFLEGIVYYALFITVIIAAVGQLGIKTTSFLAILGAASLAVGLALKDSLANFSSGVMLILFYPFKVGDVVTIGGETGYSPEDFYFQHHPQYR